MNFKELLEIYSNGNNNGHYSFSQESYMYINGEEKYLEINGVISDNECELNIFHNGEVIFSEKSNNSLDIANKLRNTLGNSQHTHSQIEQRESGLSNYTPFRNASNQNTQKIEINRKQSNKPKVSSFENK